MVEGGGGGGCGEHSMRVSGPTRGWCQWVGSGLTVIAFTLPGVLVVVPLMLRGSRSRGTGTTGWIPMLGLVVAPVTAAAISAGNQLRLVLLEKSPSGLPIITMVGDALSLLVVLLPAAWVLLGLRRLFAGRSRSGVRRRARVGLALGLGVATAMSTATLTPMAALGATGAAVTSTGVCPAAAPSRSNNMRTNHGHTPLHRLRTPVPNGRTEGLAADGAGINVASSSRQAPHGPVTRRGTTTPSSVTRLSVLRASIRPTSRFSISTPSGCRVAMRCRRTSGPVASVTQSTIRSPCTCSRGLPTSVTSAAACR